MSGSADKGRVRRGSLGELNGNPFSKQQEKMLVEAGSWDTEFKGSMSDTPPCADIKAHTGCHVHLTCQDTLPEPLPDGWITNITKLYIYQAHPHPLYSV